MVWKQERVVVLEIVYHLFTAPIA